MRKRIAVSMVVALSALAARSNAQEEAPALQETEAANAQAAPLETIPVDVGQPAAQAPEKPPTESRSRVLEEIVVTAQKREENILDVPISISAFSGDALDAKGVGDAKSLAQSIPGVTYGETVNFSIIYVRGVGTDAFLPDSDLSVAMYMDGIYFPFANGLSQSFGAIERVEVLKGPQGTLFGRNATGGAFNITTKAPSFEPELSISTGYGDFEQFTSRVFGNVPLTDTLAANVSLTYNVGDNYYEGTRGNGEDTGSEPLPRETEKGARVKVLWKPADWLDLTVTGLKHSKRGLASSAMPNIQPSLITQTLHTLIRGEPYVPPPDYEVNVDVPSFFTLDNEVVYGQLGLHPSWFDVKLLASQQDVETDNNYDFDGTRAPFITFDARGQFAEVFTAELQFISNGDWGPDWLEWVAGIYYLDQDVGFPLNRLSVADLDLSTGSVLGLFPVPDQLNVLLNRIADATGQLAIPDGFSLALVSLQAVEATAYFGQGTIHLGDQFDLTLGGRFQEETRKVIESSIGVANVDKSSTQLVQFGRPTNDDTNFSPKVVLGYKPFDASLFYLSWSKGFKSGTFNTVNVYTQPEFVEPEEVTSYELGAKVTLAGGQVQLNGAVFENEIENQQVQFVSLLAGGAVQLENAGKVGITGAEAEIQFKPDWNTGLLLAASVTYLDATYDSYTNASAYSQPTGLYNFRTGDFTGNRTVRTPEWSGNLAANQITEFSHGDLEIGAGAFFSSDLFFQAQNHAISRQPSYYTVDAQLSYLHRRSSIRVTVLGKNLSDEQYALTQFHTDAGVQEFLAPPRNFGVRLDWSFK
ncbi:MAG: TonB-dependent receptor [Panacagrimonas sp.]